MKISKRVLQYLEHIFTFMPILALLYEYTLYTNINLVIFFYSYVENWLYANYFRKTVRLVSDNKTDKICMLNLCAT